MVEEEEELVKKIDEEGEIHNEELTVGEEETVA